MLEKENPQMSGLAAATSGGDQEADQHAKRVDRYSKAKARSKAMQAHLMNLELWHDEYLKLKECGNWLKFHYYYTVGVTRLHQACLCRKHLLCPLCAILRASKFMRAYLDRFNFVMSENEVLRASLVTLTFKNGSRLMERFEHAKSCYSKFEQKRRDSKRGQYDGGEWGKVLGLVGSYEVTNQGNGWHVHMHILVLHREKIWHGKLAKELRKISGDSFIVDISAFQNPENPAKDFAEVFKYAVKFGELSLDDNLHVYEKLSGKRLIFSAGLLRGVKLPKDWMDDPIDPADLPYIEILYSYVDGVGYSMKEYVDIPF